MKLIVLSMALLGFSPFARAEDDAFISAQCQTKLLQVTTDALVKEFPDQASKVGYIGQVTFNYGIKGHPRTVFFGTKLNEDSRRCLVQVYTTPEGTDKDGCPNYVFSHFDSNCQ